MGGMLDGLTRPQYAEVVQALTPVLYDLPGKLIAIDGRPGVGKTTMARFLAWRFNVTLLETDLFMIRRQGRLIHHEDQVTRIIDGRLNRPRPIIVDGVNILRLLGAIQRPADFLIHVSNASLSAADLLNLRSEVEAYEAQFIPRDRADLRITFTA